MNFKGHLFGTVAFFMMVIFATLVNMLSQYFPNLSIPLTIVVVFAISLGGFAFFYSFTVEGNTVIAKYMGGENLGIDIIGEPGSVLVFKQVKVSDIGFQYNNADYKINRQSVGLRRGLSIPYIFHKYGISEPFMFGEGVTGMDAAENTAYLNRYKDYIRSKMFTNQFRLFLILLIGIALLLIAVGGFLFFQVQGVGDSVTVVQSQIAEAVKYLPSVSPQPGAIPNA